MPRPSLDHLRALVAGVAWACLPSTLYAADGPGLLSLSPLADAGAFTMPAATPGTATSPAAPSTADRYGFLNLLDHNSLYGTFWFPEPFLADEADVDNELRLDYFHTAKQHHQFDSVHAEFEHAFGLLTLEIAGGYASDRSLVSGPSGAFQRETEEGFTNIELAARYPILQWVSPHKTFDDTFVLGLEISPPTHTKISQDTEVVPKLSNLLRIGDHFSLQTALGLSTLIGPADHGLSTLEYSAVFGYELTDQMLPLPGILRTTPLLEFDGEYTLNHEQAGHNELLGILGVRFDFESVHLLPAQPRFGIGYVFPVDAAARQNFQWGVVTSIIFEY